MRASASNLDLSDEATKLLDMMESESRIESTSRLESKSEMELERKVTNLGEKILVNYTFITTFFLSLSLVC